MGDWEELMVFGIVGYPLRQSLSPLIHNSILRFMGIKGVYLPFETDDIGATIEKIRSLNVRGASVTIPHKEAVIPYLDKLDERAAVIGAVNTILHGENGLIGLNTDAPGALMAIREVMDPMGACCLIIGAGGTARAISMELKDLGAEIFIANRSQSRGLLLSELVGGRFIHDLELLKDISFDLVVQTTPVGMFPEYDAWPFDPRMLKARVVMDVIYNPLKTKFLKACEAMGSKVILGYKMFLYQAALQARLFFQVDPPIEFMERLILEELERANGDTQKR